MKLKTLLAFFGLCTFFSSCNWTRPEPHTQGLSNSISVNLDQIDKLNSSLSLIYSYRNTPVSYHLIDNKPFQTDDPIFFLKLSSDMCEPCMVNAIDALKKFKAQNPTEEVVLFTRNYSTTNQRLFLAQFDLGSIMVYNIIESNLSIIDDFESNYFGIIENRVIKEILPVNKLLDRRIFDSFLKAHSG